MPQKMIIDVDTGIDDSLALLLLLASPDVDLRAIASTAGNVAAPQVAENNLAWLDVCKAPPIEVALGALAPLAVPLVTTEETHGPKGVGYANLPESGRALSDRSAAELWAALAREHPGELVGLCTGPLTNLALALRAEPALPQLLRRLVVMGGAFNYAGNTTPTAEWNIFVDPEAAKEVFDAFGAAGRRPIVCALGLTETIEMTPEHMARLASVAGESNPLITHLADAVRFYMEFHEAEGSGYLAHMHDPFAAAVAMNPGLVSTVAATVDVELVGAITRATTVADYRGMWRRPPNADIATATDVEAFFDLLIDRIGTFARKAYPA